MKLKQFQTVPFLFAIMLIFLACSKKDRNPKLIVNVQDVNGTPLKGAVVHAWPTDRLENDSTNSGIPDERMDQQGATDAQGNITFNFPFSAVLDLDVTYQLMTGSTPVLLTGHRVVKIETIEQKEEENVFNETVYVD